MYKLIVNQLPVETLRGQRVFVRIDIDGQDALAASVDDRKLLASLPTLEHLIGVGARIIIGTHLGDPRGEVVESLRLDRLGERLTQLIDRSVHKIDEAVGHDALLAAAELRSGDMLLLENLRFHRGEDANDAEFALQLGQLCDVYCNDSFALAHRATASTVGITQFVRPAVAGLGLARELETVAAVLAKPRPPVVAIVAGTRLEEKLPLITNLLPKLDRLFIGGTLAFKYLKAKGQGIGAAAVNEAFMPLVDDFLREAERHVELVLPQDFMVIKADEFRAYEAGRREGPLPAFRRVLNAEVLPSDLPVDIGPWTVSRIKGLLDGGNTIIWNGPLGIWEIEPFAAGTREVARLFAERVSPHHQRAILCGESLSHAIQSFDLPVERMAHLTMGGEAALQLLAGNQLAPVAALDNEVDLIAPIEPRRPRRILIPVDGSNHSLEAARKLGTLVNAQNAQISLLYVTGRDSEIEQQLKANRVFSETNAALAEQGLTSHRQLTVEGSPADEILKFADKNGMDLIAMGSHGLTGALRLLMGSVSRKVLDQAKCPVLIVRIPDDEMVKAGLLPG